MPSTLSFGGFLGIGDRYCPLPWEKFTYNAQLGGYVVDIDRDTREGTPSFTNEATACWNDEAWSSSVYAHSGMEPFRDVMP